MGMRSRDFWLLSGSFFVCGASTNGLIGTHLIPACIERGIPEVRAAGLLAVMGVFDLVGTTLFGCLTVGIVTICCVGTTGCLNLPLKAIANNSLEGGRRL